MKSPKFKAGDLIVYTAISRKDTHQGVIERCEGIGWRDNPESIYCRRDEYYYSIRCLDNNDIVDRTESTISLLEIDFTELVAM